jgi:hypothetical protein
MIILTWLLLGACLAVFGIYLNMMVFFFFDSMNMFHFSTRTHYNLIMVPFLVAIIIIPKVLYIIMKKPKTNGDCNEK